MNELNSLAVEHPYYCSGANYYSDDAGGTWETMTDFLNNFYGLDIHMNLVFRFDLFERVENKAQKCAMVYIMHQRKGIFAPHLIKSITEEESLRFRAYLQKHWEVMQKMWEPLSLTGEAHD